MEGKLNIGVSRQECNVHRDAEGRAKLNVLSARFELNRHKQSEHKERCCL